jgi:hypothetical protein
MHAPWRDSTLRQILARCPSRRLRRSRRQGGAAHLNAYRDALKEWTREHVPLDWAMAQNNLGTVLRTLGERESGTARLVEAVDAFRNALRTLGERESGTGPMDGNRAAYHLRSRGCLR